MFGKSDEERERIKEQRKREWDELFDRAWETMDRGIEKGTRAFFVAGFLGAFTGGAVVAGVLYLLSS